MSAAFLYKSFFRVMVMQKNVINCKFTMSHMYKCLLQRYSIPLFLSSDLVTWLLWILLFSYSPSSVLQVPMKHCHAPLQRLHVQPIHKQGECVEYQCALSENTVEPIMAHERKNMCTSIPSFALYIPSVAV